jgi:hypothetical protein
MSSSDPLNIISNPPATVVKVQGTSREDVNGQFGIAVQYNAEKARYMVQLVGAAQTVMALKPDNVVKANMLESYQAQFQILRTDPRIRQELTRYYDLAQSKLPGIVKPEYAAGGIGLLLIGMMYVVGVTKTLMAVSILLLLGIIIAPDIMQSGGGAVSPRTIATNFPRRCREMLEQSAPQFLRGRLTNNIAVGIIVAVLLFSSRALLTSSSPSRPQQQQPPMAINYGTTTTTVSVEEAYKLGFEDATQGKDYGASSITAASARHDDDLDPLMNDYISPPPPPRDSKSSFGFSQMLSIFFIYRQATELGGNPLNGTFSFERFMANLRVMDTMKWGILGFSLYNLVKVFL